MTQTTKVIWRYVKADRGQKKWKGCKGVNWQVLVDQVLDIIGMEKV